MAAPASDLPDAAGFKHPPIAHMSPDTAPAAPPVAWADDARKIAFERWLEPRRELDGRPRLELVVDEAAPPRHPDVGRTDARALQDEFEGYRYPEARTSGRDPAARS